MCVCARAHHCQFRLCLIFSPSQMDLQSFLTLSEQELEEVGVEDEQDRLILLSLISHLKRNPIGKVSLSSYKTRALVE